MKFPLKVRQPLFEDDKGGGGGGADDKKDDKKGDEMPSWAKSMQTELADLKTKLAGDNKAPGAQVIPKPEKQDKPEDKQDQQQDSKSSGEKPKGFLDWLLG